MTTEKKAREFWIEMQECVELQSHEADSMNWEELKAAGKTHWQVPTNCRGWIQISNQPYRTLITRHREISLRRSGCRTKSLQRHARHSHAAET